MATTVRLGYKPVIVQCLNYQGSFPLAGRTAGEIKRRLRDIVGIAYFCDTRVNGKEVDLGHVLRGGDCLQFRRRWGHKASDDTPPEQAEAEALLDGYPELREIPAQVQALGLDLQTSVITRQKVIEFFIKRFGPFPAVEQPTLREIVRRLVDLAETATRTEEQVKRLSAKQPPAQPEWLAVGEAAVVTGLSSSTIRRAIQAGNLPASNMGSPQRPLWRIARAALAGWLEQNKGGATPTPPKKQLSDLVDRYFGDAGGRP